MTRRVEFYNGEGADPGDENLIGQLAERSAYRPTRAEIQAAVDVVGGADKPLLVRGADPSHSGTGTRTITLTNGLWCAAEDNPPAAASDAPEVYFGDSVGAPYVLDANTSGSVYRRDILQAKIDAESTTGSESRDFEDAATRALSSQSFNKRRVRTVTISVKKGTDQTSEALADANEPAPDAGYVKIFSFLVDNTGACAAAKRKRYAVGYRRQTRVIPATAGMQEGTNSPTVFPSSLHTGVVGGAGQGAINVFSWVIPVGQYCSVGSRIVGLRAIVEDVGGTTVDVHFFKTTHNVGGASEGAATQIGSVPTSDQSGNVQSLAALAYGDEVVAAGTNYTVEIGATGAGAVEIIAVEIDFE